MAGQSSQTGKARYDVAILGAGIAGSTLAACLARGGAEVLLVDAGTHPRFAVGESTIPYTSVLTKVISDRYQVPELASLASFRGVRRNVTSAGGVKRNFGFVYHREGRPQNPEEINQLVIPRMLHDENHFFRQDVDAYMAYVAVRYGATLRQNIRISGVSIDGSGVTLGDERGEEFHARYVVDASGHRSPLAARYDLHETPTRLKHHSRSLFTHMVGVRPFDECTVPRGVHKQPSPWHEGTLHHVFDGGWLWVIPFDNTPDGTSKLVSVGLTLDTRRHPKTDLPPQQEFDAFLARLPEAARQFEYAKPAREWVSTGRLQYSLKHTVGDRYCVTAHAAGFVDALYSRGLTNTFEVVNALTYRLLRAVKDDDFSAERFSFVERLEQALLDANDDLVNTSFISFRHYRLWDAMFRVWGLSTLLGTFGLQRAYMALRRTGSDAELRALEEAKYLGSPFPTHEGCNAMLRESTAQCLGVEAGEITPDDAADRIFAMLREADFVPPSFGLAEPSSRFFNATPPVMARTALWARTRAPREIGDLVSGALLAFARQKFDRHE